MIYLDNAATTWPKPEEVYHAVEDCMRNRGGSPGRGGHAMARTAGEILYQAREELAQLFGIKDSSSIVFAYNATDALNTALMGVARPGDRIVTTAMEHNAVARPLRYLQSLGVSLTVVPCDNQGRLDCEAMAAALAGEVRAVVMTHASNVTGALMPVYEVGRLTSRRNTLLIVDAAQTAGVEDIDVNEMNIDMLAFSGHKGLLGPQGTAGLYVKPGHILKPLRYGGTGSLSESDVQPEFMPDRLESGTPNTPGIAGLLAGVRFIKKTGIHKIRAVEQQLTAELAAGLREIPGVTIHGPDSPTEKTAVLSITIGKMDCSWVAHQLSGLYGIACRAGLHCAPWAHQAVGTLKTGMLRFSPGYFNTRQDILSTVTALSCIIRQEVSK